MSRSGYDDGDGSWQWIMYRGSVKSAIRGKRGQKLLTDLVEAMDSMETKELVTGVLENAYGQVCALGAVGTERGIDMIGIDEDDYNEVSEVFDIAKALAREIVFVNDECGRHKETPAQRWTRLRTWALDNLENDHG